VAGVLGAGCRCSPLSLAPQVAPTTTWCWWTCGPRALTAHGLSGCWSLCPSLPTRTRAPGTRAHSRRGGCAWVRDGPCLGGVFLPPSSPRLSPWGIPPLFHPSLRTPRGSLQPVSDSERGMRAHGGQDLGSTLVGLVSADGAPEQLPALMGSVPQVPPH